MATEAGASKLHLGIDVGSTTVKVAVLDADEQIVYSVYRRHHADVRATVVGSAARSGRASSPTSAVTIAITGSGGLLLSQWLGIEFVQEVIASKTAVETFIPKTDVAIELGGEDAKIIYFDNGIEQRMNGTCAGGTGAFIDQMAALLDTDAGGPERAGAAATPCCIPSPAAAACSPKPTCSRCSTKAPSKEDIAASIFQSVVTQTISGLACGRPIRGHVAFLGGPLQYLPELRKRFYETLELDEEHIIVPDNAHLFVASGCALAACRGQARAALRCGIDRLENLGDVQGSEVVRLPPLFTRRSRLRGIQRAPRQAKRCAVPTWQPTKALAYLGIDAGSTTFKSGAYRRRRQPSVDQLRQQQGRRSGLR